MLSSVESSPSKNETEEQRKNSSVVKDAATNHVISKADFDRATKHSRTLKSITNEDSLNLYALFKYASVGPLTAAKPSALNIVEVAKWEAYNKLGGTMSKEEAMKNYFELISKLDPKFK